MLFRIVCSNLMLFSVVCSNLMLFIIVCYNLMLFRVVCCSGVRGPRLQPEGAHLLPQPAAQTPGAETRLLRSAALRFRLQPLLQRQDHRQDGRQALVRPLQTCPTFLFSHSQRQCTYGILPPTAAITGYTMGLLPPTGAAITGYTMRL